MRKFLSFIFVCMAGSPSFASFELVAAEELTTVLIQSFPNIGQTGDCYAYFSSESLICRISEANATDVNCDLTGTDSSGVLTNKSSTNPALIEVLRKTGLSFRTMIEINNLSCSRSGGDPVRCRGQTLSTTCTIDTYMSN